ncbi:hypothetical protein NL676_037407 [Syzygium grande]|nr:hypothetical protein NL676_037407 [Syzygium grande]
MCTPSRQQNFLVNPPAPNLRVKRSHHPSLLPLAPPPSTKNILRTLTGQLVLIFEDFSSGKHDGRTPPRSRSGSDHRDCFRGRDTPRLRRLLHGQAKRRSPRSIVDGSEEIHASVESDGLVSFRTRRGNHQLAPAILNPRTLSRGAPRIRFSPGFPPRGRRPAPILGAGANLCSHPESGPISFH